MKATGPREGQFLPLDIYGDQQQITRIFYRFTAIILLGQLVGIIIVLTAHDLLTAGLIAISILPVLAVLLLIKRGYFEASSILLALTLLTLVTVIATLGLGVHHISTFGYAAILIVASLVTKRRTMVFLTLYTEIPAWLLPASAVERKRGRRAAPKRLTVIRDFDILWSWLEHPFYMTPTITLSWPGPWRNTAAARSRPSGSA